MIRSRPTNRGTVLVAVMLVLGLITLGVATSVTSSGDDVWTSALRADSVRAFFAAESGVVVAIRQSLDDPANPLTGTHTLPNGATFDIIDPFDASPSPLGTLEVEGARGHALRRVRVSVQ